MTSTGSGGRCFECNVKGTKGRGFPFLALKQFGCYVRDDHGFLKVVGRKFEASRGQRPVAHGSLNALNQVLS